MKAANRIENDRWCRAWEVSHQGQRGMGWQEWLHGCLFSLREWRGLFWKNWSDPCWANFLPCPPDTLSTLLHPSQRQGGGPSTHSLILWREEGRQVRRPLHTSLSLAQKLLPPSDPSDLGDTGTLYYEPCATVLTRLLFYTPAILL